MSKMETAYHEAGHAVVAYFLRVPIEEVSIIEDEESLGRSLTPLPESFEPDERAEGSVEVLESHLAVCLAGAVAQEILSNEPVGLTSNDLSSARTLLGSLGGSSEQMSAAADKAEEKARGIVRREWVTVETLAVKLLEQKALTGDEVVRVIQTKERA